MTLVAGALMFSATGVFIALSGANTATTMFFRCLIALPIVGCLAVLEVRRRGALPWPYIWKHSVAGAILGVDFALWAQSFTLIGVALGSVLANSHVLVTPLIARALRREAIQAHNVIALAPLLTGVWMVSEAGGHGERAASLMGVALSLGSGIGFSFYVVCTAYGSSTHHVALPVLCNTLSCGIVGTLVGSIFGPVDMQPELRTVAWLAVLTITGQVIGQAAVAAGLPRVGPSTGSAILVLTPVGSVLLAVVTLSERLATFQVFGAMLVIAGVVTVTVGSHRATLRSKLRID